MSGESDRSQRVETSVHVYRLRLAPLAGGAVVFAWDYPGSTLLRVRIVRTPAQSDRAGPNPEPSPEPGPDTPWRIVYDGDTGSFRDGGLPAAGAWRYAVFARDGDGPWTLWRDEVVTLP